MECGYQRETTESKPRDLTKAFMFTEEQITKQLVDMREQTDFMRKFRGALGIALREIKTLRTASSSDHSNHGTESTIHHKRHSSCSLPSTSTASELNSAEDLASSCGASVSLAPGRNVSCVCGDIGQADLTILKEYLAKMAVDDSSIEERKFIRSKAGDSSKSPPQLKNMGNLKDSQNMIENSIRQIENLKNHVARRNAAVIKLCQQLTQARLIRMKRETKLDEKLKELAELKGNYEKLKKQKEKQVKITKGLRLTLNAEKQRVKSYENMSLGLEETRRAFSSLKSQAGQLMQSLRDKDHEIAELTSQIAYLEESKNGGSYFAIEENVTSYQNTTTQIHGLTSASSDSTSQTDFSTCATCERSRKERETLQEKYDRLYADFQQYRWTHRAWEEAYHSTDSFRSYNIPSNGPRSQLNHPYGRRRMHASYTSPDSYRRVSRPPLRRRLSREDDNQVTVAGSIGPPNDTQTHVPDQRQQDVLSPIEEYGEVNHATSKQDGNFTVQSRQTLSVPNISQGPYQSSFVANEGSAEASNHCDTSPKISGQDSTVRNTVSVTAATSSSKNPDEATMSPTHDSGFSSVHDGEGFSQSSKSLEMKHSLQLENLKPENHKALTKASYLEVATPPNGSSHLTRETEDSQQLCMNSFIRYNDAEDTASEQSSLPNDDLEIYEEAVAETPITIDAESNPLTFGVIWHPELIKSKGEYRNKLNDTVLEKNSSRAVPSSNPLLLNNGVSADQGTVTPKTKRSGRKSRCVIYKGHKIDVTDFSIHAFRDIVWSLDDGPDSADNFIKFLASLAKKLNSNPKWAGKHSMGNPEDWLALRGLY